MTEALVLQGLTGDTALIWRKSGSTRMHQKPRPQGQEGDSSTKDSPETPPSYDGRDSSTKDAPETPLS